MSLTTQTPRSKKSFIGADQLVTDDEGVVANTLRNDSHRSRRTCKIRTLLEKEEWKTLKKNWILLLTPIPQLVMADAH